MNQEKSIEKSNLKYLKNTRLINSIESAENATTDVAYGTNRGDRNTPTHDKDLSSRLLPGQKIKKRPTTAVRPRPLQKLGGSD